MRLNKNLFKSLNEASKKVIQPEIEEEVEEIAEAEAKLPDINDIDDKDIADYVIRYNQVVNRALRARFMSRARRKAV
tara:strand:+ start:1376 stop:1606 length:231 start_codon:yes stop_codon:yes gene_type:complete